LFDKRFYHKIFVPETMVTYKVENGFNNSYDTKSAYKFKINTCPGELILEEGFEYYGKDKMLHSISDWLIRIWEELQALPFNREINNIKTKVDELYEQFSNISDDYFNDEEAEKLKEKLDELHNKFEEQIRKQKITEEELSKKIEKLDKEIDSLKQTVKIYNKKNWFKSFSSKILNWASDPQNQKMIKNGVDIVKGFLPPNNTQ